MLSFPFPDMQVRGEGTVRPPPLTDQDLAEMWGRAEKVQDQQIQTDGHGGILQQGLWNNVKERQGID